MIFGRKRKASRVADEQPTEVDETVEELDEDVDEDDLDDELDEDFADDDSDADDDSADDSGDDSDDDSDDEELDEWDLLDASQDWREDGPFDISEVDLDADDVERLDFGCLVLTPFEGMQMQLQVDQRTKKVQAALVMAGPSAIEIALFAAPAQSTIVGEIRDEMIEATQQAGGQASLAEGPFGTEVRRVLPVTDPKGNKALHVSRTWFAEGPKWLLRGVVMGEAAQASGSDGASELLYEFFSNTVVRRDAQPRAPKDLIPMVLPSSLAASQGVDGEPQG